MVLQAYEQVLVAALLQALTWQASSPPGLMPDDCPACMPAPALPLWLQVVYYESWEVDAKGQPTAKVSNRSAVPGLSLRPGITYVEQSQCKEHCGGRGRCAVVTSDKNKTSPPLCQ
jgi:hypothetical protein